MPGRRLQPIVLGMTAKPFVIGDEAGQRGSEHQCARKVNGVQRLDVELLQRPGRFEDSSVDSHLISRVEGFRCGLQQAGEHPLVQNGLSLRATTDSPDDPHDLGHGEFRGDVPLLGARLRGRRPEHRSPSLECTIQPGSRSSRCTTAVRPRSAEYSAGQAAVPVAQAVPFQNALEELSSTTCCPVDQAADGVRSPPLRLLRPQGRDLTPAGTVAPADRRHTDQTI
jgi:hypothetical protein